VLNAIVHSPAVREPYSEKRNVCDQKVILTMLLPRPFSFANYSDFTSCDTGISGGDVCVLANVFTGRIFYVSRSSLTSNKGL